MTTDISDNVIDSHSSDLISQCFSMMYDVPGIDKGIDEDKAPLEAIQKMI